MSIIRILRTGDIFPLEDLRGVRPQLRLTRNLELEVPTSSEDPDAFFLRNKLMLEMAVVVHFKNSIGVKKGKKRKDGKRDDDVEINRLVFKSPAVSLNSTHRASLVSSPVFLELKNEAREQVVNKMRHIVKRLSTLEARNANDGLPYATVNSETHARPAIVYDPSNEHLELMNRKGKKAIEEYLQDEGKPEVLIPALPLDEFLRAVEKLREPINDSVLEPDNLAANLNMAVESTVSFE